MDSLLDALVASHDDYFGAHRSSFTKQERLDRWREDLRLYNEAFMKEAQGHQLPLGLKTDPSNS